VYCSGQVTRPTRWDWTDIRPSVCRQWATATLNLHSLECATDSLQLVAGVYRIGSRGHIYLVQWALRRRGFYWGCFERCRCTCPSRSAELPLSYTINQSPHKKPGHCQTRSGQRPQ